MPVADTWVSPSTVCFDFGQQISKAEDIRIYHDKINAQQVTDILV
jgi:hypothetical protein